MDASRAKPSPGRDASREYGGVRAVVFSAVITRESGDPVFPRRK